MKFSKNKSMRIFVYKSLIIFFLVILGFKITFSYAQRAIERKIDNLTSKEYIDTIKQKLRSEMKNAIEGSDSFLKNRHGSRTQKIQSQKFSIYGTILVCQPCRTASAADDECNAAVTMAIKRAQQFEKPSAY